MTLLIKTLAAVAAGTVLATSAFGGVAVNVDVAGTAGFDPIATLERLAGCKIVPLPPD